MNTFKIFRTYKTEGYDYCNVEAVTKEEALKIAEYNNDIIDWKEGEVTDSDSYHYNVEE